MYNVELNKSVVVFKWELRFGSKEDILEMVKKEFGLLELVDSFEMMCCFLWGRWEVFLFVGGIVIFERWVVRIWVCYMREERRSFDYFLEEEEEKDFYLYLYLCVRVREIWRK